MGLNATTPIPCTNHDTVPGPKTSEFVSGACAFNSLPTFSNHPTSSNFPSSSYLPTFANLPTSTNIPTSSNRPASYNLPTTIVADPNGLENSRRQNRNGEFLQKCFDIMFLCFGNFIAFWLRNISADFVLTVNAFHGQ